MGRGICQLLGREMGGRYEYKGGNNFQVLCRQGGGGLWSGSRGFSGSDADVVDGGPVLGFFVKHVDQRGLLPLSGNGVPWVNLAWTSMKGFGML